MPRNSSKFKIQKIREFLTRPNDAPQKPKTNRKVA